MSECETPEPELGAGGPGEVQDQTEDELQVLIDKLCELGVTLEQLVSLVVASDPDGDGIINIEGMVDVNLEGQCLTVANCEGTSLSVELTPANISAIAEALQPLQIEQDCTIGFLPIKGCLDGECVHGIQTVQHTKSTGVTEVLGNSLPAGASDEPCPCVIEVALIKPCCDIRKTLTDGEFDIAAELGLGPGYTIPSFTLNLFQTAVKDGTADVVDCAGNPSVLHCGQQISYSGGGGDQHDPIQSITLGPGDLATLEARVCPPSEFTDV